MEIKHVQGRAVNTDCYIFVRGYLCCCVSWICFHPAVEVMQKRSPVWLPALSVPDVGKWQAFLPEWFVEGASMAPVFSVHSCWGALPHLCIAVLCVRFRVEEIRWKTVSPVLTLKSPFWRLTKMEKDCSNEDPSSCWHWTKKKQMQKKRDDHDVKRSSVDLQCDSFQELLDLVVSPPMFLFAVLPLL